MKLINQLNSIQDSSVNFIFDNKLEARFVQRSPDYFIIYLSSHNGCNKACRFCHLTQTKQTEHKPATIDDYILQATTVLDYYKNNKPPALKVHFNFMARGEFFDNLTVKQMYNLFNSLSKLAKQNNLDPVLNISSILPKTIEKIDPETFFILQDFNYSIYYSLYSVDESFRKRWLPNAADTNTALEWLAKWQQKTNKLLTFHWAFIKDENDSQDSIEKLINTIQPYNFNAKFNLVRYNPFSENQGIESDEKTLQTNFKQISEFLKHPDSRIVPRVGFDVKASCGMF